MSDFEPAAPNLLGGFLRCMTCQHQQPLGNVASYATDGWPRHCGQTMRWVIGREDVGGRVTPVGRPDDHA